MEQNHSQHELSSEEAWAARQRYWQRTLGRLRLGVEPLEEQVAKYRRVTWMLTLVTSVVGLMFVSLFAAFRRADLGLIIALLLVVPVVGVAWLDFLRLERRAERYLRELRDYEHQRTATGRE
jgi:hypothetical protein